MQTLMGIELLRKKNENNHQYKSKRITLDILLTLKCLEMFQIFLVTCIRSSEKLKTLSHGKISFAHNINIEYRSVGKSVLPCFAITITIFV